MTAPRIAITGAAGRMGRTLVQALADHPQAALAVALEHPDSPHLGADSGQLAGLPANGVPITAADWDAADLPAFDVLIDFSTPAATLAALAACRAQGRALVIGTTGIDAEGLAAVDAAAAQIPLVMAPNYAVGVNLLLDLVASAARVLGDDADVEVIEAHHRHKVDAPSGTALRLGEVLADALERDLEKDGVFARHGITGARQRRQIGFSTIRGGDIVGDHTVLFAADGERLEITHRASSRLTFARGAVRAAAWLHGRPAGRYGMREVLFG